MARTDALAVHGLNEATDRADAALDAGADVAFVEALATMGQVVAVPKRVHGPCLLNVIPGGKTPLTDLAVAEELGYKIAICPGLLLGAAVLVGDVVLKELAQTRRHPSGGGGVGDLFRRFGAEEWDRIRAEFA